MTTPPQAAPALRSVRLVFGLALLAAVPALWIRWSEPHLSHGLEAVLFGLAIVGAAFLLAWAAEAAQLDVSASLAIGVLALIAVLPEYAVGFVFAWKGGTSPGTAPAARLPAPQAGHTAHCALVLANMTGANRLLIGIGWSMIVFIA